MPDLVIYRIQCACITRGCFSAIAIDGPSGIELDDLDWQVPEDRRVGQLLRASDWWRDHGKWVCGNHSATTAADDEETPHPVSGDHDHRPPHGWIRPSSERIDNAVESIIQAVQAVRSMDQMMREEVKEWQPSKFTRKQWRFFAEDILRADARWRWEHPEEPV